MVAVEPAHVPSRRVNHLGVAQRFERCAGRRATDECEPCISNAAAHQSRGVAQLELECVNLSIREPDLGYMEERLLHDLTGQAERACCPDYLPPAPGFAIVLIRPLPNLQTPADTKISLFLHPTVVSPDDRDRNARNRHFEVDERETSVTDFCTVHPVHSIVERDVRIHVFDDQS